MEEDHPTPPQLEVPPADVVTLHGHESEVYMCSWSPTELSVDEKVDTFKSQAFRVLELRHHFGGDKRGCMRSWGPTRGAACKDVLSARGRHPAAKPGINRLSWPLLSSGDGTTRIWNLNPGPNFCKSSVLLHEAKSDKAGDVTTIDWNHDGSLLATGSYDGLARIWTKDGRLRLQDGRSGKMVGVGRGWCAGPLSNKESVLGQDGVLLHEMCRGRGLGKKECSKTPAECCSLKRHRYWAWAFGKDARQRRQEKHMRQRHQAWATGKGIRQKRQAYVGCGR
eukprot:727225-Pelagomonas_calceolata.AAC.8